MWCHRLLIDLPNETSIQSNLLPMRKPGRSLRRLATASGFKVQISGPEVVSSSIGIESSPAWSWTVPDSWCQQFRMMLHVLPCLRTIDVIPAFFCQAPGHGRGLRLVGQTIKACLSLCDAQTRHGAAARRQTPSSASIRVRGNSLPKSSKTPSRSDWSIEAIKRNERDSMCNPVPIVRALVCGGFCLTIAACRIGMLRFFSQRSPLRRYTSTRVGPCEINLKPGREEASISYLDG